MSNGELLNRLATGDEEAARVFESAYKSGLLRYLHSRGVPSQDRSDLVQEVFLAAFQQIQAKGFKGLSSVGTWLTGILNHKILDYWETRRRAETDFISEESPVSGSAVSSGKPDPEELLVARQMLDKLPEDHRMILLLHEAEGWSTEEIAQRLGMRPGTVGRKLWEARRLLSRDARS